MQHLSARAALFAMGLVAAALAVVGCAQQPFEPKPFDSESHWMEGCDVDADCGALACVCGVCTEPCAVAECAGLEPAVCAPVDGCADDAPLCLAACDAETPCADGLRCVDGGCMPPPPGPQPRHEQVCDGADDDGDGQIDEGLDGGRCFAGEGICQRIGVTVCGPEGFVCDAAPGLPEPEVCNGLDDDCDGVIDDGDVCAAGPLRAVADVPAEAMEGDEIVLDAGRSAPLDVIERFEWRLDLAGGAVELEGAQVRYRLMEDDELRGALVVRAGEAVDRVEFAVLVGDYRPLAWVEAVVVAPAGEPTVLTAFCRDDSGGADPIEQVTVRWHPGAEPELLAPVDDLFYRASHVFAAPGQYDIEVECVDEDSMTMVPHRIDVPAR